MITISDIPTVPQYVIWEDDGKNKVLIYNPNTEDVISLNAIGTAIWKLCDGRRPISQIVTELRCVYNVSENTCLTETMQLLRKLQEKGFVEW